MIYNAIVLVVLLFAFYKFLFQDPLKDVLLFYQLRRSGVLTEGKVIDMEEVVDSGTTKMYKPKIEFRSEDGERHTFSPNYSINIKPKIGKYVKVYYKKDRPEIAIKDNGWDGLLILLAPAAYVIGFSMTVHFILKYLNTLLGL